MPNLQIFWGKQPFVYVQATANQDQFKDSNICLVFIVDITWAVSLEPGKSARCGAAPSGAAWTSTLKVFWVPFECIIIVDQIKVFHFISNISQNSPLPKKNWARPESKISWTSFFVETALWPKMIPIYKKIVFLTAFLPNLKPWIYIPASEWCSLGYLAKEYTTGGHSFISSPVSQCAATKSRKKNEAANSLYIYARFDLVLSTCVIVWHIQQAVRRKSRTVA